MQNCNRTDYTGYLIRVQLYKEQDKLYCRQGSVFKVVYVIRITIINVIVSISVLVSKI